MVMKTGCGVLILDADDNDEEADGVQDTKASVSAGPPSRAATNARRTPLLDLRMQLMGSIGQIENLCVLFIALCCDNEQSKASAVPARAASNDMEATAAGDDDAV